jgi:hypothetical protein
MHKDLRSIIHMACALGTLTLSGCSSSTPAADTGKDAGYPGAGCPGAPDAGGQGTGKDAGRDAGGPSADAGCPAADAGCPAADAGCPGKDGGASKDGGAGASDPQTPPTGAEADIVAWIAKGDYKAWKSEPAVHDGRPISPHGKNRIFSNAKLSANGPGDYPVGSASVKELYDGAGALSGHAIGLKTKATGTDAWYWFEKVGTAVYANAQGAPGCNGCHSAAGSDVAHSGHDFVYTQVP